MNYALREDNDAKLDHKEDKNQVLDLQQLMDKNPKTINPEYLHLFEYEVTERRT